MALFRDARPQIIADLNTKNNLQIKLSEVTFGVPQAVSTITPAPSTTKNTRVYISAAANSPYSSRVPVFYDRLDFGVVFAYSAVNTLAKVRSYNPVTIHGLIPDLNNYYGLELTTDDIEDGVLSLTNGSGSAVIKAKPDSLTWIGQFTVSIAPGDMALDRTMTVTDLSGIDYPSGQHAKGQAEVYSYSFDASAYYQYLQSITLENGPVDPTQDLVDFILDVTGDTWVLTGNADYSLAGAKVVYNGPNSLTKPSNPNFDYIVEIRLGTACNNFAGTLRFHYNIDVSIDTVTSVQTMSFNADGLGTTYSPANADYGSSYTPRYNPFLATAYNDYTPQAAVLSNLPWQASSTAATTANATALAAALKAVDTLPWVANSTNAATVDYNLYNVWIRYNGPVANAPHLDVEGFELRSGFNHVMYICPPYTSQANLWSGMGVVYYNV